MKNAKVIRQTVYESTLAMTHGYGKIVERIVLELAGEGYLAITSCPDQICVCPNFDLEGCKIIGEIEVPDHYVEKAIDFIRTTKEILDGHKNDFKSLIREAVDK